MTDSATILGESLGGDVRRALPIVGVGASAGGLEALVQLFRGMDPDLGLAFVVVQHLSPDFDTMVDELLGRQTRLAIRLAQNEILVEPNTIYVMPPKVEMIIAGGRLLLTERRPERGLWLPIDAFFRSLAEDSGGNAIAIVLSGTGSDGSRGMRAIHDVGGLTVAQDPRTAKFDGMPRSAIDTGVVDLVLPPQEMPHALRRYAARLLDPAGAPLTPPEVAGGATAIFELLHKESGVDFSHYKTATIGRRLDRRLLLTGAPSLDAYAERLRGDSHERDALYQDLLIGVTSFLREPRSFDVLSRTVLPELIRNLSGDQELRVWSAGCATGEEAYSLAIAILECFRELDALPRLRLFATDVHPRSIEVASAGVYSAEHAAENLPAELVDRYFVAKGQKLQVRSEVRGRVVFARHNLLRDAPFTRLDLISCRHVIIYFKPQAQKKLMALFHFALRTGGVLFLGPSETPSVLADELIPIDRRWKLYRKRREVRIPPDLHLPAPRAARGPLSRPGQSGEPAEAIERAREALLERYAPPSLLVSSSHGLLHSLHGGSRYLRTPEGVPSLQLLDLVEGDLRYALAGALKCAADESRRVSYEHVPAVSDEGAGTVRLTVAPLAGDFLVTLEPQESRGAEALSPDIDVLARERIESLEVLARERIESLELELRYAKESLQATIEEMEASNEELQVAIEEMEASNEELHAANEELHSISEELHSVNAEHQLKIKELRELSSDMEHLLIATEVHTLFLDDKLCLRKLTPRMGETFRIRKSDVGRRIDDFAHRLVHDSLIAELERVLATGERIEREVRDHGGAWYLLRILPYLHDAGRVAGVVLTLIDITSIKSVQRELSEREGIIQGFLEHSPAPLWARDLQGRYLVAGRATAELLGKEPDVLAGKTVFELLPASQAAREHEADQRVLSSGSLEVSEEVRKIGDESRIYQSIRFPLRDGERTIYALGGVASDITDRKRAEEQARLAVERRDRFLAMLSHELRNPLAAIANGMHLLEEEKDEGRRQRTHAIIRHQLGHLSKLLDDLLDVTRVVQGRMRVRAETFVLNEVIRAAASSFRLTFADKRIVFHMRIIDTELVLHGDPLRIEQVVVELLHNAAKFTPAEGRVELVLEQQGEWAELRVRDTGAGLTPEEHSRVFELFYQRDDSMDRPDSGLGVGLALARDLVQSHGGTISATSDGPRCGTELVVRLPLARANVQIAKKVETSPYAPATLRVVIVEDSEDSLELLQLFLEHLGHQTYTAASGTAGLAAIQSHIPDIALVDIGLPGMSGLDVARAVRGDPDLSRVYMVALTGYGRPEDRKASFEAGFHEHITKPVSRDALERVLRNASGLRDSRS